LGCSDWGWELMSLIAMNIGGDGQWGQPETSRSDQANQMCEGGFLEVKKNASALQRKHGERHSCGSGGPCRGI
jgi:hypothetical protein